MNGDIAYTEEITKRTNIIVFTSGLQDPYFLGEDNTAARWTNADLGKLFSNTCVRVPLELRIGEEFEGMNPKSIRQRKKEFQYHLRMAFFEALSMVQHHRFPRDEAVGRFAGAYKLIEQEQEQAQEYLNALAESYPNVYIEGIVEAALAITERDANTELMESFGMGLKRGAREYLTLKSMNNIGKRMPWKIEREYDLILLHTLKEFEQRGIVENTQEVQQLILEDLAKDKYTERDPNGKQ